MDKRTLARFLAKTKISRSTRCWIWQGATAAGYGLFWLNRKLELAHRVSYEHFVGPIPEGKMLDHLCSTPLCCNPTHLDPVSNSVNQLRAHDRLGTPGARRKSQRSSS